MKKKILITAISLLTVAAIVCGIIFIPGFFKEKPVDPAENTGTVTERTGTGHGLIQTGSEDPEDGNGLKTSLTVSTYGEIYKKIKTKQLISKLGDILSFDYGYKYSNQIVYDVEEASAPAPTEKADGYSGYSTTNVQVTGVDEGDIVKTDGKHIFVLESDGSCIYILGANNGRIEKLADIKTDVIALRSDTKAEFCRFCDMYLDEESKKLIVIADTMLASYGNLVNHTTVMTFDISDCSNPSIMSFADQEGNYRSSRLSSGYLCVFSDLYRYKYKEIVEEKPETYVPVVNGSPIPADCIYIPAQVEDLSYTVITSMNINNPYGFTDKKAILGSGCDYYVSGNNIYLLAWDYDYNSWNASSTNIYKLSYKDGVLTQTASGAFKGEIRDQFAMDETNGYFRVCATVYTQQGYSNTVYVLDENLNITGKLENIAPDERIYSARYLGDLVYFVTYRETDPLFSVDLSDPQNPRLLGELHLPGYSEYLHPFGENRLLGFGIDSEMNEYGYNENVLKLSMFDITDPVNVKELHTTKLSGYTNSDLLYNHRALTTNVQKGIIAFPATGFYYQDDDSSVEVRDYIVMSYNDAAGFTKKLVSGYTQKYYYDYYYYGDDYEDIDDVDIYNPYVAESTVISEETDEETDVYNPYANGNREDGNGSGCYSKDGYVYDETVAIGYDGIPYFYDELRGVYIDDCFYVINTGGEIRSYRMPSFEKITSLEFSDPDSL